MIVYELDAKMLSQAHVSHYRVISPPFLMEQSGASVVRFSFCNVSRAFSGCLAP